MHKYRKHHSAVLAVILLFGILILFAVVNSAMDYYHMKMMLGDGMPTTTEIINDIKNTDDDYSSYDFDKRYIEAFISTNHLITYTDSHGDIPEFNSYTMQELINQDSSDSDIIETLLSDLETHKDVNVRDLEYVNTYNFSSVDNSNNKYTVYDLCIEDIDILITLTPDGSYLDILKIPENKSPYEKAAYENFMDNLDLLK